MSRSPTSPNPDIGRLIDEGYDVALVGGLLCVSDVPFVDAGRAVRRGRLVVPLNLAGDRVGEPRTHTAWWSGGMPCGDDGRPLTQLVQSACRNRIVDVAVDHLLCNKPRGREFHDYHELVTTYVALLSTHAAVLEPDVTARRQLGGRRGADMDAAPFRYVDTATARDGTGALADGLRGTTIGIVGLGGTGSYVLDLVAKTPVHTIHLFDGDVFEQHNAFRTPGAATFAEVAARRRKVDHLAGTYSRMHEGIVSHARRIDERTAPLLDVCDFVFLCIDDAAAKPAIINRLVARSIPFVDVGMGLSLTDDGLFGAVRTTYCPPGGHERAIRSIPTASADDDVYGSNIQLADLNAFNASLAVIAWKRHVGFYPASGTATSEVFVVEAGRLHRDASR